MGPTQLMSNEEMDLVRYISRMTLEARQFLDASCSIADFLAQFYLCLCIPSVCLCLFHFSSWQGELPGLCAKIILFNQKHQRLLFALTDWDNQDAVWALNHIAYNFIPFGHLDSVLIHRER